MYLVYIYTYIQIYTCIHTNICALISLFIAIPISISSILLVLFVWRTLLPLYIKTFIFFTRRPVRNPGFFQFSASLPNLHFYTPRWQLHLHHLICFSESNMEKEQGKQKEKKIDEGNMPNIFKEILLEIAHFFIGH